MTRRLQRCSSIFLYLFMSSSWVRRVAIMITIAIVTKMIAIGTINTMTAIMIKTVIMIRIAIKSDREFGERFDQRKGRTPVVPTSRKEREKWAPSGLMARDVGHPPRGPRK